MENKVQTRKGQMSFELLIVVGFVLVLFIPILFFSYNQARSSAKGAGLTFIDNYADALVKGADLVYYSGEGSYIKLYVNVPKDIRNINVTSLNEGSVLVISTGESQITKYTKAPLRVSNIEKLKREGSKEISIAYGDGGVVTIS